MKNLKLVGLLFLIGIYFSCDNDDKGNIHNLSGIYTETSPVSGRTQLIFVGTNTVIKSEPEYSIEDTFTYELTDNIIKLTPTWDNSTTAELEIEIINNSKFEIENLYSDIPENETTFITFEK